ncbi:MAG: radical SAM family RiPP maturation amino acid epimerase [Bacillota bacterium]
MEKLYFCGDFSQEVTTEEKKLIPHLKRFFECLEGDIDFYEALKKNPEACNDILKSRGIFGVDPVQMKIYVDNLFKDKEISISNLQDKPQALLWRRWVNATRKFRDEWFQKTNKTPNNKFNAWHSRNINRCDNQLSKANNSGLIHATIVFELSKGCSLHCPFCGLASKPLEDVFLYTKENAKLWKEILDIAVKQLGDTVGTGVCYWATEPTDNSDYFKFIEDFGKATGVYPQTTTAAPLRDLEWTRKLLQFRKEHTTAVDRFSILSKNDLKRVHQTFTAEELSMTELILQYTERKKKFMALSGRNRKKVDSNSNLAEDFTIACATGYLVNMVDRTIKLISPCPPSDQNPLGYHIYAQGKFNSPLEFNNFIEKTIEKFMSTKVQPDQILAFRDDLNFTSLKGGFQLKNKYKSINMQGSPHLAQLGKLISEGNLSSSVITDKLISQSSDVLAIMSSIQKIFDKGLLK